MRDDRWDDPDDWTDEPEPASGVASRAVTQGESDLSGDLSSGSERDEMATAWLHTAGTFALLSRDDEQRLALAVHAQQTSGTGSTRRRPPPLHAGGCARCQDAREALVNHNLRLIVRSARKYERYTHKMSHGALGMEDLLQAGAMGLMHAVEKFDPARGTAFSTYATHWITQAIDRISANEGATIREPVHVVSDRRAAYRRDASYTDPAGRTAALRVVPLEAPRHPGGPRLGAGGSKHDEDTYDLLDTIADDDPHGSPEEEAERQEELARVRQVMERALLSRRERQIVIMRYGLDGNKAMTLEELGRVWHLSRERVRQIERGALDKLRRKLVGLDPDVTREYQQHSVSVHAPLPPMLDSKPATTPSVVPKTRRRPALSDCVPTPTTKRGHARASATPNRKSRTQKRTQTREPKRPLSAEVKRVERPSLKTATVSKRKCNIPAQERSTGRTQRMLVSPVSS